MDALAAKATPGVEEPVQRGRLAFLPSGHILITVRYADTVLGARGVR